MLGDPLFFYHHPSDRTLDVVEDFFRSMADASMEMVTLGEYARWWQDREQMIPAMTIRRDEITVAETPASAGGIWLEVSLPDGRTARVGGTPVIRLAELAWHPRPQISVPADLRASREFDPRTLLGDLFSTLSRKFR